MEPRLVKCFFEVLNIDYTNIDRAKKQMKNNKQKKKFKSINNQSIKI